LFFVVFFLGPRYLVPLFPFLFSCWFVPSCRCEASISTYYVFYEQVMSKDGTKESLGYGCCIQAYQKAGDYRDQFGVGIYYEIQGVTSLWMGGEAISSLPLLYELVDKPQISSIKGLASSSLRYRGEDITILS